MRVVASKTLFDTANELVLVYHPVTGELLDVLDSNDECIIYEPSDMCGGCTHCILMQIGPDYPTKIISKAEFEENRMLRLKKKVLR